MVALLRAAEDGFILSKQIGSDEMSWTPVSHFMPVTFENEFGWPQSAEMMGYFRSERQAVVRFERRGADEDFPHAPGRWVSCCSERWDVTDEIVAWRPLFEKPTGRMPDDPVSGHFVDTDQLDGFRAINKALYGDGSLLSPDTRRDLAHRLHHLLGVVQSQEVVL